MLGNVWEWTCSAYDADYGGEEKRCADEGPLRVIRGGSWSDTARPLRSALRFRYTPDGRNYFLGFRLAQDL